MELGIMEAFEQLESNFKGHLGKAYNTVAVNSGTSALHVGIEALQLPLGSKILVPDYCMYAVPRAVVMAGHVPVFADCFERTLNLDIDWAVDWLGKFGCEEIKAVVAVHNYGRQVLMEAVHRVSRHFNWRVVEDLAEIHGVSPHPDTSVACWSFYKNKIIYGEEGGMIAVKDAEMSERAKSLRCLGFTPNHDFWHYPRGLNARLSNSCAKLILESLAELEDNLAKRVEVENLYNRRVPIRLQAPPRQVPWVYDIRLPGCTFEILDKIVSKLNSKGIAARQGFKCNSFQPEFRTKDWKPISYMASQEVMYLPLTPEMTEADVKHNVAELIATIDEFGM